MTSPVKEFGSRQKTRSGCFTWIKRILLTFLIILMVLPLLGITYQNLSTQADKKK